MAIPPVPAPTESEEAMRGDFDEDEFDDEDDYLPPCFHCGADDNQPCEPDCYRSRQNDSVERAKQAQALERERFTKDTGIRLDRDGRPIQPREEHES